jgi:hypothetical protein
MVVVFCICKVLFIYILTKLPEFWEILINKLLIFIQILWSASKLAGVQGH